MMLTAALIFAVGSLASTVTENTVVLTIARVLLGTAVWEALALVPLYLAEMTSAKHRGTLSTLNQLMITTGILSTYMVNLAFDNFAGGWRIMLGFAAIPATILFLRNFVFA